MSPKDQDRIGKTYTEERDSLLGYIRKRIPENYEAEDILQDVFYQLTRGFNELSRIENMRSWLYTVTNNKITDRFRKRKTQGKHITYLNNSSKEGPLSLDDILPDLRDTPEDVELKQIIWETIDNTLDDLPEEQSEVFIMHEFEEMSFNEISEMTGVGVNTLISRKRYAVIELRNRLKHLYNQLKSK
ncbi:MAG: sigma-70 family RNA polymerase sigma factor [Bacteroidales bacterium]|nr:sigma-70 family RNA polymerase sigma factor [Bacteroidales bacterium]